MLQQECSAVSADYMGNPTLVKTLAAALVSCMEAILARRTDPGMSGQAAVAVLEASRSLLSRAGAEDSQVIRAGLLAEGVLVLQAIETGLAALCPIKFTHFAFSVLEGRVP